MGQAINKIWFAVRRPIADPDNTSAAFKLGFYTEYLESGINSNKGRLIRVSYSYYDATAARQSSIFTEDREIIWK